MTDFSTVCAIDIGALYSGYAYHHKPQGLSLSEDEDWITDFAHRIRLIEDWGKNLGLKSYKTLTSLLTNPSGFLEEFGYDAEYKFGKLCARSEDGGRQFYPYFKMQLINEKIITKKTAVTSSTGNRLSAHDVYEMALQFFKEHFLKTLESEGNSVAANEIQWVLTLPAQWYTTSQDFFRSVAKNSGLVQDTSSNQLVLLPESEAAATWCRSLDIDQFMPSKKRNATNAVTLNVGSKFMVIDAGGTIDVTSYEIQSNGKVREVEKAVKFDVGGHSVNNSFDELMTRIYGAEFIQDYKKKNPDFWFNHVDVMFEKTKRSVSFSGKNPSMKLPMKSSFSADFKKETGNDIDDLIKRVETLGVSKKGEEITFNESGINYLHDQLFSTVVPKIHQLLKSQQLTGLKYIFLVGGCGLSEIFKREIEKNFSLKYVVLVPEEADIAVLRGAVLSVLNPEPVLLSKKTSACKGATKQHPDSHDQYKWVCAIDFGTTYSGYAYGESGDLDKIIMNKEWDTPLAVPGLKTSTSVLTNAQLEFEEFGTLAVYKYSKLCADDDGDDLNLYRNFKMLLHNEKDLNRSTMVTSTTGTQRPAFDIFTMALHYLRGHFMEAVKEEYGRLPDLSEIRWVITIPAIWSDKAKQFMREVAHQAGLIPDVTSRQLLFALEPEAAALYLQDLQMQGKDKFEGFEESTGQGADFTEGSKYMVVDAGGGTVDITVQEILPGGNIKQLDVPSGGHWGGNTINAAFEDLMTTVFGSAFIQSYKQEYPADWLEVEVKFELEKRGHKPDGNSKISLPITTSFDKYHERYTKTSVEDAVKKYESLGVEVKKFRLVISPSKVFDLYLKVITFIIPHIEKLLESPKMEGLKHIFLVGGFAESMFLRKAIGDAYFKYVVLTPMNASTAVLRGAVIYGHNPERIASRVAKKTYGCKLNVPFITGKHDPAKRVEDEYKKSWCKDVFEMYVKEGDQIKVGEYKSFHSSPFSSKATSVSKKFYSTDHDNTIYVDEDGVEKLAELKIPMLNTEGGTDREIETKVYFGGTEITVESRDVRKGSKVSQITLNFLCGPDSEV